MPARRRHPSSPLSYANPDSRLDGHGTRRVACRTAHLAGFTPHRGTISLSDVRTHRGRRYFSHLVMKWTTSNTVRHREVLNWKRDGQFWIWVGNF